MKLVKPPSKRTPEKEASLLAMSEAERERAFDTIGRDLNSSILDDARDNNDKPLCFALAVLVRVDGTKRVAHYTSEFGDGEGIACVRDFIASVRRTSLLRDGEQMEERTALIQQADVLDVNTPKA